MIKIPANIPFRPEKTPVFYGWIILFAGIVGVIMSIPGQTMGVSVFTDHLIADLSIDRVRLSLAYLLGTGISGFIITYAGILYDRMGARVIAMGSGFFLGIMLIYLTKVDALGRWIAMRTDLVSPESLTMILLVIGFLGIRFFGQGVLTMTSRNMVMKWFDRRRGFANAFLGAFTAFGFSYSPRIIQELIDSSGWRNAWIYLALAVGVVFIVFVFFFFRDNPEDAGLIPDGVRKPVTKKKIKSTPDRHFTLREAVSTYSFWVFNLTLTMNALYLTAYTFHVTSIFEYAGFDNEKAVSVFLPISLVAIAFTFIGSWASDYMKLKFLLILNTAGLIISMVGFIFLDRAAGIPLIIAGNGVSNGMFGILMAVTWPRFFGIRHLGSISGFALSWTVIGSAAGPFLFSLSEKFENSYNPSVIWLLVITGILFLMAFRANNINDGVKSRV